jgi:hypothetical protein
MYLPFSVSLTSSRCKIAGKIVFTSAVFDLYTNFLYCGTARDAKTEIIMRTIINSRREKALLLDEKISSILIIYNKQTKSISKNFVFCLTTEKIISKIKKIFKKDSLEYDISDGAKKALTKGIEIAKVSGAEIYILSVGRIPEYAL